MHLPAMNQPRKLGKKPAVHDKRTLLLADYIKLRLPIAPASQDWSKAVDIWPMYLNDRYGDCTAAAAAHMVQCWSANGKHASVEVTDKDVIRMYSDITGFDPGDASTDNGAVEMDVLKYWRKQGIGGHRIGAFTAVNPKNDRLVKDAIWLTGGLYVGIALPESAQGQRVWDVPPGGLHGHGEPGSWGGHAVPVVDYDDYGLTCITWGETKRLTWQFMHAYTDEAYCILSPDFLNEDLAPNGFNARQLADDLRAL